MKDFEYILRYILNSKTLKLTDIKRLYGEESEKEFYERFPKNDVLYVLFTKKDKNTIVPLLNLPINFEEVNNRLFYGAVSIGKTFYADKEYAKEFSAPEGFDNFVVYDDKLKVIADFEENGSERNAKEELSSEIADSYCHSMEREMNNGIGPYHCTEKISRDVKYKNENDQYYSIDKERARKEMDELLNEYREIGVDYNDEQENIKLSNSVSETKDRLKGDKNSNDEEKGSEKLKQRNKIKEMSREDLLARVVDGGIDIKKILLHIKKS